MGVYICLYIIDYLFRYTEPSHVGSLQGVDQVPERTEILSEAFTLNFITLEFLFKNYFKKVFQQTIYNKMMRYLGGNVLTGLAKETTSKIKL